MLGWKVIPRVGFGDFALSPHGIGIAIGVFIGALVMARRARRRGFPEEYVWTAVELGVVGALLGARTAYVVGHSDQFTSPTEWLRIWEGGISLVGGLLGAFLFVYVYSRVKNLSFLQLGDLASVGLAVGIAVGRIGDLVIGDHLGKQTSGWWGWRYLGGELISPPPCFTPQGQPVYDTPSGCIEPGMVVHQTAIYDMVWCLAILGILLLIEKRPRQRGFLFFSWAALYALGRIATDFARVDKHWFDLGLTGSQLTSIVGLLLCLFMLAKMKTGPQVAAGAATATYALESPESAEEEREVSSEAVLNQETAPANQEPLLPPQDIDRTIPAEGLPEERSWTEDDPSATPGEPGPLDQPAPVPDDQAVSSTEPDVSTQNPWDEGGPQPEVSEDPDPWDEGGRDEPSVAPYEPTPWTPSSRNDPGGEDDSPEEEPKER